MPKFLYTLSNTDISVNSNNWNDKSKLRLVSLTNLH